jgi:hypothetical protein
MKVDYSKGKIYKITNDYNDEVYVGSTCDSIGKRFCGHKYASYEIKSKHLPLYKLINEIGIERFRIQLIEEYPCEDKYQLIQKEGEYIRELGTLNKRIAGRTGQEYRKENKDKIKETQKIYHSKNKEIIKEKSKEYHNSEHAKQLRKAYEQTDEYKEKKRILDKNYRENNSEKINLRKKEIIVCECGVSFQRDGLARHKRSAKHTTYENDKIK